MWPFTRKQPLLPDADNKRIVEAIRSGEKRTSGEIRVYIESRNPLVNTLERAATLFYKLNMQKTHHRNGVLIYVAMLDKELAIYGDEGIHQKVGTAFWNKEISLLLQQFRNQQLADGLVQCITEVGEVLSKEFPYQATEDKNELPDEIVFGR
jgi:uncharacterized membrane protein